MDDSLLFCSFLTHYYSFLSIKTNFLKPLPANIQKFYCNQYYSYILTTANMKQQPKHIHLEPQIQQEIHLKRQYIERIKAVNAEKLTQSLKELEGEIRQREETHTTSTVVDPNSIAPKKEDKKQPQFDKNPGVSDTDRMVFDKKFKNFLNHRQEYLDKARRKASPVKNKGSGKQRPPLNLAQAEYYNEEEVLSNTGSEYQYQNANDMHAAYLEMTTGKKRKGGKGQLFPPELNENELRRFEFQVLLNEAEEDEQSVASISKDRLLNYLFDEPIMMMLYSINPYQLGDELAEFETKITDLMNYDEFSQFLLVDREPTYFEYSPENLAEARKLGRGIKCAPIIAKWIDETGIFQFLVETYKSIDVRGDSRVDRVFLAKKLRKEASVRRITQAEIIEVVNINKKLPLNRILYELEFEQGREDNTWSEEQFINFLQNYQRRQTPEKDKLITKLILTGKYDSSYVYVVSQQVLQIIKDIFNQTPKFAEYFVVKQKFLQKFCNDPRYKKIQSMLVRSESNRYVKKETVEQTLIRMYSEGETYLDIEEILDFMTNRGRPKLVEYKVYMENLYRQLAIIEEEERIRREKNGDNDETASSDEQFNEVIRQKQVKRKQDKLKAIKMANNFDVNKKFNVTIPMPFGFDTRDKKKKESIREKKLKEMLAEKERKLEEEMKPLPVKEVPEYVKENLYDRMLKEQERERKERLQKFRLEIMSQVQVSDRLMRPKSKELHCEFGLKQYKFAARPMPYYCQIKRMDRIDRQKQERKEKILEEVINKHSNYELPDGVQRMLQRQEEKMQKREAKARTASTGSVGECTFIPRITDGVPDFKQIHQRWYFDLENAKEVKEPIKMMPFSFDNRPEKSKTTYQKPKPREDNVRHSKYERVNHEEEFQNIPKTQKFEALVELRRKQLEEKEREQQKEKRSEAVRKLRESKFAPVVWRALKQSSIHPSKSRAIIADRIKQFKRDERRRKEEYENQMIRILTKVYERPLLLESGVEEKMEGDSRQKEGRYENEQEYLQGDFHSGQNRGDLKLMLERQKKEQQPHMNDDHRRAVVEGHHLGQYPPEGYEMEMEDYDEDEEEENGYNEHMYQEQFEVGNLHTS